MLCTSIVRNPRKRCKDPREAFYFGGTDGIHYGRLVADRNRRYRSSREENSLIYTAIVLDLPRVSISTEFLKELPLLLK